MNPFIPEGAVNTNDSAYNSQYRIGIQGQPKTSKTWASTTFPNPIFLSYDRGLTAHIGKNIPEIPFYDNKFIDKLCPKKSPVYVDIRTNEQKPRPSDKKGALLKFLYNDALRLTSEQTLVIDGNTGIQAAFHSCYWTDPAVDTNGKIKPFAEWGRKIDYLTEVAMCLKALSCNIIYICHEVPDRDDEGRLNGKVRPLLSGGFVDEMASHYTDWFRATAIAKPARGKEQEVMDKFAINRATLDEWCRSTPEEHRSIYLWQTYPDSLAQCGTSLINVPKFIPANYESFRKYQRKQS